MTIDQVENNSTSMANSVPAKRGEGHSTVYSRQLNNRARALLEDVFELADAEQRRGGRDVRAKLLDQYHNDPLSYLERVLKVTRDAEGGAEQGAGNTVNIKALYLQAVQAANQPAPVQAIDVTPEPGVQSGYTEW